MKIDSIVSGFSILVGVITLIVSLIFVNIKHKKECHSSHSMKEAASTKE